VRVSRSGRLLLLGGGAQRAVTDRVEHDSRCRSRDGQPEGRACEILPGNRGSPRDAQVSVVMKMEGVGIDKMEGRVESERELGVVGLGQDLVHGTAIMT
jgi:hypothetical protein